MSFHLLRHWEPVRCGSSEAILLQWPEKDAEHFYLCHKLSNRPFSAAITHMLYISMDKRQSYCMNGSQILNTHNTQHKEVAIISTKQSLRGLQWKEEKTSMPPLNFYRLSHRNTYPGHAFQPVQSAAPLPPSSTCLSLHPSAMLLSTFKMKTFQSGTFNPACKNQIITALQGWTKPAFLIRAFPCLRGWYLPWTHRSRHWASLLPGTSVRILYQSFPPYFSTAAISICVHQTDQELKSSPASILTGLRQQQFYLFPVQISEQNFRSF